MSEELNTLIASLPTSEFKQRLCAEIAIIEFQRSTCMNALQIIVSGELPDGDGVNVPTVMFADETLKRLGKGRPAVNKRTDINDKQIRAASFND